MNRSFLLTAVVALIASSDRTLAQASSLPVIRPKVTELGELRDTTLDAALVPQEAVLSPRGTLVAYRTRNVLRIWNATTHSSRLALKGWSADIVWSPAGDAIAFVHESEGPQDQLWILRVNPTSGAPVGPPQRVSLASTSAFEPQFSPDGKTIAFLRQGSGARSLIVLVPAAGGAERVLASAYRVHNPRWSADGSAIYYLSSKDSATTTSTVLSKVGLTGGTPSLVHEFTGEIRTPTVSADNRVAMIPEATTGVEQSVQVVDLIGRPVATLSIPAGVRFGGSSGESLRVGVREVHPRGLRIINVADGKSRELIDTTADVQAVSWFADSKRFAAIVFYHDTGVFVTMNADGTGLRKVPLTVQPSRSTNVFAPPIQKLRVSPDGKHAVYLAGGTQVGGRSLELLDLVTGKQQTLERSRSILQPFWLQDSRTVRYTRIGETSTDDLGLLTVHDISLDGVDTQVRAFPKSQYSNAVFMTGVNIASVFGGTTTALARLDGSPDQILPRRATRTPSVLSPDGRIAATSQGENIEYFAATSANKITLFSPTDGKERTVDLALGAAHCGTFSPDSRSLFCRGRETVSSPQTWYEVPVDGSKPRVVARIDSKEIGGASALSPDGKSMLQTVAGVRKAVFVGLDFTDGMTRLLSSMPQPAGRATTAHPHR